MTFKPGDFVVYTNQQGTEYRAHILEGATVVGRNRQPAVRIYVHDYTEQERDHRRSFGYTTERPRVGRRRCTVARLRLIDKK